ncbi:M6 family metalloprotease domain-containing protein [Pilimelia anulata]|uniref:M6 family metalloprotease domain-containing protein n=1 Tax=Pilimelia anulata TaxID=53371 RepID=UPI00227D7A95|nr:M6 family metalloprotease domain-containing protein [Pilimelia anulata]
MSALAALSLLVPATPAAAAAPSTDPFAVLDPQNWQNPDKMTWDDYKPVPNANWADPGRSGSIRNFKIAMVALDYPDQAFAATQKPKSDVFGNPGAAASNIPRDQVAGFYRDFLNKPNELNRGHTLHEYWMQDSEGRYGVDLTGFGPYKMPGKAFEYGIESGMNPGACPSGATCGKDLRTDGLGAWKKAVGEAEAKKYELIFILSAGQDESSVWQEFGQMMFKSKEDVPAAWGPPGGKGQNWAKTRYVDWTSWKAASAIWPNASGNSSTQAESSGMATFAHELTHLLNIGDNYNNPYGNPPRRAYTGIWSMMSRGAFNGPGGPHTRWQIPPVAGASMGSLHTLRDKMKIKLVDEQNVLRLSREALAKSGPVVAEVTARAVPAGASGLTGINIAMDKDKAPACNVNTDPLCDGGGYNNYTVEVVGRLGPDSFTPDNGVMLSKTKNADTMPFQWVIDSHPEDINMIDFYRPDGAPQKITIGDYRQLSDALLHAGTRSGSEYEYVDEANRMHFYVLDLRREANGTLRYTVAVRSLDGAGQSKRGVTLGAGKPDGGPATGPGVACTFDLANTGSYTAGNPGHPEDASAYLQSDVYKLSAKVAGAGWRAELPNALAQAKFGATAPVRVAVGATAQADETGVVTLTATSVSDASKTATAECRVPR